MKNLVIGSVLLALSGVVHAESTPAPIELWNGFTTASSKEEIKAFKAGFPGKKVEIIHGCASEMGYRNIKGRIVTITFIGQDRDENCHARLLADFLQRFGEPEREATTFGSVIGDGQGGSIDMTSPGVVLIWREGEKKTKLVKTPGNGYNVFFTVREDKYLY